MLRGYSLFENPPTTMTDVRTSNIKAGSFDLRLDDFIVNVDVNLCGGQSALIVILEQGPVAPLRKTPPRIASQTHQFFEHCKETV
jgi:hypothetical protein